MNRLNQKNLFLGICLILFGTLAILNNYNLINFSFYKLFKLWPALFLFWGISLLPIQSRIKSLLSYLLLAIALLWLLFCPSGGNCSRFYCSKSLSKSHINATHSPNNGIRIDTTSSELFVGNSHLPNAKLIVQAGMGSLNIKGENQSSRARVTRKGDNSPISLEITEKNNTQEIFLFSNHIFDSNNWRSNLHMDCNILLDNSASWDFEFNIGLSTLTADLSALKAKKISVNSGLTDIYIKLGNKSPDDIFIDLSTALSNTELEIPSEFGIRISKSNFLSDINLQEFEKKGDYYYSKNYDNTKRHVLINSNTAFVTLKIQTYDA